MAENTSTPEKMESPAETSASPNGQADAVAAAIDSGDPVAAAEAVAAEPQTPAETVHAVEIEQESKKFVLYRYEDYRFHLGGLGDLGPAYRLIIIFGFMLVAAAAMYMGAWWFVGTHPLAQN
jgi:hypothetical protein